VKERRLGHILLIPGILRRIGHVVGKCWPADQGASGKELFENFWSVGFYQKVQGSVGD
jgi:hypothetical protein